MTIAIAGLRVIGFELSQAEGQAAILSVKTDNPGLAALAGLGAEYTLSGAGVGFKGHVHNLPSDLGAMQVTVEFIAQPSDMPEKLKDYANTLRALPYYDPLFFGGDRDWGGLDENGDVIEDDRDPAEVLETRSAYFHIDPATHAITLSDILEGSAGTIAVGALYDAASFRPMISGGVVNEVTCDLSAEWNQAANGKVDIARRVSPAGMHTLTMPRSFTHKGDVGNDSGWSVEDASFHVVEGVTDRKFRTGETENIDYVKRDVNGLIIDEKTVKQEIVAPLKRYGFTVQKMLVSYDYSQARRETVSFRMRSDAQAALGDRVKEKLGPFALASVTHDPLTPEWRSGKSYAEEDRVQFGGKAYRALMAHVSGEDFALETEDTRTSQWLFTGPRLQAQLFTEGEAPSPRWKEVPSRAALPDARSASFFDTERGQRAIEHVALRMRAYLRKHMRSYSVSFRGPWETLSGVTLNHEVSISHWSLPGGSATGKVTSYRKVWNGEDPGRSAYVEVTIGMCAGGGSAPPDYEPGAGYSSAFDSGYANGVGPVEIRADDVTVTVSGPAPVNNVDVYRLADRDYAVTKAVWSHLEGEQYGAAIQADYWLGEAMRQGTDPLPITAVDAVNAIPTTYSVRLRKLHSGGVLHRKLKAATSDAPAPRNVTI